MLCLYIDLTSYIHMLYAFCSGMALVLNLGPDGQYLGHTTTTNTSNHQLIY